jgi:DNA mismatch repair protein MutS
MRQWRRVKDLHPDKLILFRMGDFYELFGEDAREASVLLEIALTTRERGKEDPMPMAGIPHHALEPYLGRLLRAGKKVVLCDQMEDPSQAKGIVRREVTRVVTPGTVLEEGVLDGQETVLLASWCPGTEGAGLAWADLSSGALRVFAGPAEEALDRLRAIEPREVLFPLGEEVPEALGRLVLTVLPKGEFDGRRARETLCRRLGLPAALPGLPPDPAALGALAALVAYLREQGTSCLQAPLWEQGGTTLAMDEATRRNLELVANAENSGREGTLVSILDSALTPMGSRLVREWVLAPPADRAEILSRQAQVSSWLGAPRALRNLRNALKGFPDLARVTARLSAGIASPRDAGALRECLSRLPSIREAGLEAGWEASDAAEALPLYPDWRDRLCAALLPTMPPHAREGRIFAPGYHAELDRLRELSENAHGAVLSLEARERDRSGIPSLKVRYNKVFGYFLEVSRANLAKVPPDFERRQTLTGAERYVTPELKELESRILSAREEREKLEGELWASLLADLHPFLSGFRDLAAALARMDALSGFSHRAAERGYTRPELVEEPVLEIEEGRHPVLEADPRHQPFVPNPIQCDILGESLLLVTGPNMGGKSTYLRQNALLAVMAHVGSFVPAAKARIGLCDRIFCRVGAGDSLLRGLSTFMVEMTETAAILRYATRKSLVLLDEVGRGTSTYDGLAIAWAVVEALRRDGGVGCRTLFATHYHELTELGRTLPGVKNLTMGVREHQGRVIFLKTVEEGAADRSYGIHVAELAGVPAPIVSRAKEILGELESRREQLAAQSVADRRPQQPSLFATHGPEVEAAAFIAGLDLDRVTPLDALAHLDRLKKLLGS